jgi:hypothetical protein
MTHEEWHEIGCKVLEILDQVLVRKKKTFGKHAKERGITPEQLAAAAITECVRERVEGLGVLSPPWTTTTTYQVPEEGPRGDGGRRKKRRVS